MRFQITSGILRVSDPGYADIKKSDYSHVYALFHTCRAKKGTWNVRCPSNKGYTKYLLACHKDVVNLAALNWTPLGKAPVDSGQMGVYDAHEYPQTYRDHERFYDTLLDEDRRVHVVGDWGVICSGFGGDGQYPAKKARDGEEVVAVRIDFF